MKKCANNTNNTKFSHPYCPSWVKWVRERKMKRVKKRVK